MTKDKGNKPGEKRKCDMYDCDADATHFASPLGNPDEGALCDYHYKNVLANSGKILKDIDKAGFKDGTERFKYRGSDEELATDTSEYARAVREHRARLDAHFKARQAVVVEGKLTKQAEKLKCFMCPNDATHFREPDAQPVCDEHFAWWNEKITRTRGEILRDMILKSQYEIPSRLEFCVIGGLEPAVAEAIRHEFQHRICLKGFLSTQSDLNMCFGCGDVDPDHPDEEPWHDRPLEFYLNIYPDGKCVVEPKY